MDRHKLATCVLRVEKTTDDVAMWGVYITHSKYGESLGRFKVGSFIQARLSGCTHFRQLPNGDSVTDVKGKNLTLLICGLLACDLAHHHIGPISPVTSNVHKGLCYDTRTVVKWHVSVSCMDVDVMGPGLDLDMTAIGIPTAVNTVIYTAPGRPGYSPHPPTPFCIKDGTQVQMSMTTTTGAFCILSVLMLRMFISKGGVFSGGCLNYTVTFTSGDTHYEMPSFTVDPTTPIENIGFRWNSLANNLLAAIDPSHRIPGV